VEGRGGWGGMALGPGARMTRTRMAAAAAGAAAAGDRRHRRGGSWVDGRRARLAMAAAEQVRVSGFVRGVAWESARPRGGDISDACVRMARVQSRIDAHCAGAEADDDPSSLVALHHALLLSLHQQHGVSLHTRVTRTRIDARHMGPNVIQDGCEDVRDARSLCELDLSESFVGLGVAVRAVFFLTVVTLLSTRSHRHDMELMAFRATYRRGPRLRAMSMMIVSVYRTTFFMIS
jgi:hypothetical protein